MLIRRTVFTVVLAIVTVMSVTAISSGQDLEIHCIDVGQGDCTLIISPSGQTMLVDAAEYGEASNIKSYVNGLGIYSIDYFVPSHYHADHIGGLSNLIGLGLSFGAVYDRGWEYCTQTYTDYYVPAVQSIRNTLTDSQVIDLGSGVTVTCLALNGNGLLSSPFISDNCSGGGSNDENDFCVALKVEYNEFQFFVAGDLSGYNNSGYTNIETSVGYECGDIDIYRVNHHGSFNSSNPTFLASLDPEVSVISVGNNSYGHPATDAVNRILAQGSVIYQTEDGDGVVIDGDIVISTTGYDEYVVEGDSYALPAGSGDTTYIADIQDNFAFYNGNDVTIQGVITQGAGDIIPYFTDAYIEDFSGKGINLYDISLLSDLEWGNWVEIEGTVGQNSGTTRIEDITSITVLDTMIYVWDTPFTTGAANDIAWEGTRMWVDGEADSVIDYGDYKHVYINDGSGDLAISVDDLTGININGYSAGNFINAYGVCDVNIAGADTTYRINISKSSDISKSTVNIKMIPNDIPTVVTSAGGSFQFTGMLRNNTDNFLLGDVWIMLVLPNGYHYGPLQNFPNIPLQPHQLMSYENVTQDVPYGAMVGDYFYVSYAGIYPNIIADSSFFPFRILPAMAKTGESEPIAYEFDDTGWNCYGFGETPVIISGTNRNSDMNIPEGIILTSNYPNPFNPVTKINYTIPNDGNVSLGVYNLLGQEIERLVDNYQSAGNYSVDWDGSEYSSGVYYYSLKSGELTEIRKMTLIK
ncbi:MAG: T9SS type A sorting domain-containing protein [candidate division Zixibacteria bacterium]|nr:T9SS type A sorting domain-containing protein [candidate division Zixibacteria bacterium]